MLNLFICDDNPVHLRYEAEYVRSLSFSAEYALKSFEHPRKVVEQVRKGYMPDVAILDIEMPKVDGITLAEELNRLCPKCRIIFLTGFTQYTYDAYYANHIWYVLKTDMEKYLPAALKKAISCLYADAPEPYLSIRQKRTESRLPLRSVLYLERNTYRTKVKMIDGELFVRTAPADLLHPLPSGCFIRCHQSYWVNTEKISTLVGQSFLLIDGTAIPISRTYRQSAVNDFRARKTPVQI